MSLTTQFGRFVLACILALAAFPVLYAGTIGANHQLMTIGLLIFGAAMVLPLVGFLIKSK